jgi:hypothetical protein
VDTLLETIGQIIKIDNSSFFVKISSSIRNIYFDMLAFLKDQLNNLIYNNIDEDE